MPVVLDKGKDFAAQFVKKYEDERRANLVPVLDASGNATGKFYDPRFQKPEGQPNPARLTAHLMYLQQQGIPIKSNVPIPQFDPVERYQSNGAGETIANTLMSAANQSLPGALIAGFKGSDVFDLSHWDPSTGEGVASTLLSFLVPPSGKVLKMGGTAVAELAGELGLKSAIAQVMARGAGALGAYEGAQAGLRTHDPVEALSAASKGGVTGAVAGGAGTVGGTMLPGIAGKIAAPVAEVAAFGTVGPTLEGRKPIWDDYLNAAGVILGMKAAHWGGSWAAKKAASASLKATAASAERLKERVENDGVTLEDAIKDEIESINTDPGKRMFRVSAKNRPILQEFADSFKGKRRLKGQGENLTTEGVVNGGYGEVPVDAGDGRVLSLDLDATEPYWKDQGIPFAELAGAAENALAGKPISERQWGLLRKAYKLRGKWGYEEGMHQENKTVAELGLSEGDEVRIGGQWHRVISKTEDGTVTLKNGDIIDLTPIDDVNVDVRPNSRTPIVEKNVPARESNVKPEPTTAELLAQTKASMAEATKEFESKPVTMTADVPEEGKAPAHGIQKSLGLEPSVSPAKQPTVKEPWEMVKQYKGSDGGNYADYALGGKRNDGSLTVELDKKNGYRVRNVFVGDNLLRQGNATAAYEQLNTESITKTGKPLRSSEIGYEKRTGVTTMSPDAEALWESFVSKGKAQKVGDHYEFKPSVSPAKQVEGETPEAAAERMGIIFKGYFEPTKKRPNGSYEFIDPKSNGANISVDNLDVLADRVMQKRAEKAEGKFAAPPAEAKPSVFDKVNVDAIPAKMEAEVEVVDAETGKRGKAKVNARETYKELEKKTDLLQKLLDCLRSG